MNNDDLGKLIEDKGYRDAVHIAIAPVVAGEKLYPGDHVGIDCVTATRSGKLIGIVDPFLRDPLHDGDKFYMMLYPNTIQSLRHHWVHPSFEGDTDIGGTIEFASSKDESEQWLKEYAEAIGIAYSTLLESARTWVRSDGGEYYCFRGSDTPDLCYNSTEMWNHLRAVVDFDIPADITDDVFFTCSC